jgi:hypothetical protein
LNIPITECVVFLLKGYPQLENKVRIITREPNFGKVSTLGIMLDADRYPNSRVRKAANAFKLADFPSEENALKNDNVCSDGGKKAGVFVSPGNGKKGCIENLVIEEIRATEISKCLSDLEGCIKRNSGQLDAKGLVQSYISVRNGSLCGLGRAFEAGVLDVSHDAYKDARQFIGKMLER